MNLIDHTPRKLLEHKPFWRFRMGRIVEYMTPTCFYEVLNFSPSINDIRPIALGRRAPLYNRIVNIGYHVDSDPELFFEDVLVQILSIYDLGTSFMFTYDRFKGTYCGRNVLYVMSVRVKFI